MVALNQNRISPLPSHHSASIRRQTPLQNNSKSPTPIRLFLRARYYDPHTAEFISTDPLEYVDGMSLFRGYFLIISEDPTGYFTRGKVTKQACINAAQETKDGKGRSGRKYKNLVGRLGQFGVCKEPEIVCTDDERCKKDGTDFGGFYDPEHPGKIFVCFANAKKRTAIGEFVVHETVHYFDNCLGSKWTCREIACSEIRAYSFANCQSEAEFGDRGARSFRGCVRNGAIQSVEIHKLCKENARKHVDDMFDECFCQSLDWNSKGNPNKPTELPDWPWRPRTYGEIFESYLDDLMDGFWF